MITNDLTLDKATHTYRYKGNMVPGTTTVLADVGIICYAHVEDRYRDRGVLIHEATELDDAGALDEVICEESGIMGWVRAWQGWKDQFEPEFPCTEQAHYDPELRVAGTWDRGCRARDHFGPLDIKSGDPEDWHIIQLASYASMDDTLTSSANGAKARRAWNVYLREDGQFKNVDYDANELAEAAKDWRAAVRIYNRKHRL